MEQREPRIIRREIHFDFLIAANHDHVFRHARGGYSCNLGEFKTVAVQVDRMNVVARVASTVAR
jgi:hypothetical protein